MAESHQSISLKLCLFKAIQNYIFLSTVCAVVSDVIKGFTDVMLTYSEIVWSSSSGSSSLPTRIQNVPSQKGIGRLPPHDLCFAVNIAIL